MEEVCFELNFTKRQAQKEKGHSNISDAVYKITGKKECPVFRGQQQKLCV